ncbi:hypothetical protein [Nostoc phage Nsp-JY21]
MTPQALKNYESQRFRGATPESPCLLKLASSRHFAVSIGIHEFAIKLAQHEAQGENPIFPQDSTPPARSTCLTFEQIENCFVATVQDGYTHVHLVDGKGAVPLGAYAPGTHHLIRTHAHHLKDFEDFTPELAVAFVWVLAFVFSLINSPRKLIAQEVASGISFSRQHQKRIRQITGAEPLAYTQVGWDISKPAKAKLQTSDGGGSPRALHWSRGHWRRCDATDPKAVWVTNRVTGEGTWRKWIRDCWKGSFEHGLKLQSHAPHVGDLHPPFPTDLGKASTPSKICLEVMNLETQAALYQWSEQRRRVA